MNQRAQHPGAALRSVSRPLSLLVGLLLLSALHCGQGPRKSNVVLITLDTTRRDHLSCYGYELKTTPNLEALGAEGIIFENCLAMTSWTLPSHASLFTGLYPTTHGAHYNENAKLSLNTALHDSPISKEYRANGLSPDAVTLAETLRGSGYATGGVGGGPWLKRIFGMGQGFDFYDCDVESDAGRPADTVTNLAIPFLRDNAERPFFLFLNYFDPHFPYSPPGKFKHAFSEPGLARAAKSDNRLARRYRITQYDGEIHYVDHYLGILFKELERLGLWDDTWIIVTGDHGEHIFEKGLSGHGFALFEGTLQVPLIIKPPKGASLTADPAARVQLVHIMPTILEGLRIEPQAPMDVPPLGRSSGLAVAELYKNLGNVKFKAGGDGQRYDRNLKAIYMKQYKLIESTNTADPDSGLFDLQRDPGETTDLAAENPDLTRSLREALESWCNSLTPPLQPLTLNAAEVDQATEEQLEALGY